MPRVAPVKRVAVRKATSATSLKSVVSTRRSEFRSPRGAGNGAPIAPLRRSGTKQNQKLPLSQVVHLLHRMLIGGAAILYCVTTLQGSVDGFEVMRSGQTPLMNFASYSTLLVAELVGTTTVAASPLMQLLDFRDTPRSDTLYVDRINGHHLFSSFTGCAAVNAADNVYGNGFLRSLYYTLVRDTAHNLTFLSETQSELIVPVVDCTSQARELEDTSTVKAFFLVRNKQPQPDLHGDDRVKMLTLSFSNQGYTIESRDEKGSVGVATVACLHSLKLPVTHHFALALGYPYEKLRFEVYEYVDTTRDSFWKLRSVPTDSTTEVARTLLTASRTGFFLHKEAQHANIKNEHWGLSPDALSTVAYMNWIGRTVLTDSWAWVHLIHALLGLDVILQLLILLLVVYRNWQKGTIWIGDAFMYISKRLQLRACLVVVSWYLNECWALSEYLYLVGNKISQVEELHVEIGIVQADLMVVYLATVDLVAKAAQERIDPAFTLVLFFAAFRLSPAIIARFPRLVAILTDKTLRDYQMGVVETEAEVAKVTPMRLWNVHALGPSELRFTLAVLSPLLLSLGLVLALVAAMKLRRRLAPHQRAMSVSPLDGSDSGGGSTSSLMNVLSTASLSPPATGLTRFEAATGVQLAHQFGLRCEYDNVRTIKGLRFVSADGVYSNGFVVASGQLLVATEDVPAVALIKLLRFRYRHVYVYDVEGGARVQQMARLVYPDTLSSSWPGARLTVPSTTTTPGALKDAEAAAWRQQHMSSFTLSPVAAGLQSRSQQPQPSQRRSTPPPLLHRTSDPHVSDQELQDAVEMSEHARWANLGEPVYAEKDLEIFRPPPQQSTLPVYYAKTWLPYAADTVFNALFDARYRLEWDARNVRQLFVVERRKDGDVMYCAQRLSWPFAHRDYVYHRRTRFFAAHHSFVVVCQAMHHGSAPQCNGLERVETYALRLCIRSTGTSSCDVYVEYEDDTDFSIPNYVIGLLLAANVPSFMHDLRAACANYANYTKTLSDSGVDSIPSQVVRKRSEPAANTNGLAHHPHASQAASVSDASSRGSESGRSTTSALSKRRGLARRRRGKHSDQSDDALDEDSVSGSSSRSLRLRALLKPKAMRDVTNSKTVLKKTSSTGSLLSSPSLASSMHSPSSIFSDQELRGDDFVLEFHKQKIGLHLETDLYSNKVLVAYCEKESEAAKASVCIEPGLLVTSVNGNSVAAMSFNEIMHEIKTSARPLSLGFTLPDKENSKTYRRFKEPTNVLKCLVARDEHDLVCALRPLNEDASLSAVLKADFLAPAYSKRRTRALGGASSRDRDAMVVVPEGFLVYEIDDCFVLDLTFAEIAHLLRRNNEPRIVTFKAALAVESDRLAQQATRSALSKRLSGVFKWRSSSFDDPGTASSSASSSPYASSARQQSVPQPMDEQLQQADKGGNQHPGTATKTVAKRESHLPEITWGEHSPGACLSDYSAVAITSKNLAWAWEHVHLLKADERIFSAALLIRKLETYLMQDGGSCGDPDATVSAKTILTAMHEEHEFLTRIKERSQQGMQALREFNCEEGTDWQFGQTYVGVTTHWKPGEDGTVWLKLDGLIEGVDIFHTIAVIRETDMYNVWVPFCNRSLLLQQNGRVDVAAYMSVAFPLLQRDAVIKAFGINACYESRAILLLGKTVDESSLSASVQVPKARGWNADRMEMRGFRALIEPITRTKARVCIVANIDPKCPIPRSLLNFGIKKVAGILLYLVRKEAEKIEQAQRDGSTDNEHLQRIQHDPTHFYSWLGPLMEKWFDDQRCNLLPPPMSLTASGDGFGGNGTDGTSDKQSAAKNENRTTPFHHNPQQHQHGAAAKSSAEEKERVQQEHRLLGRRRMLIDYLYDFGIWPYMLMFIFSQVTPETGFLHVCALKFIFTCTCTWFGVPGAFSWQTRRVKRARRELDPLRRRCVVLAGLVDVLNSWFLRVWAHWFVCYLPAIVHQFVLLVEHQQRLLQRQQEQHGGGELRGCFDRTPLEVRESENFWLIGSAFLFATVVVAIQIVVNI